MQYYRGELQYKLTMMVKVTSCDDYYSIFYYKYLILDYICQTACLLHA